MVAVIELTWSSVAGDAIALDIAKVGTRRAEIAAGDPGVARLDDDAAAAGGIRPLAARTPAPMPRLRPRGAMWPVCHRARAPALPPCRSTCCLNDGSRVRAVSRMRPSLGLKSSCGMAITSFAVPAANR